MSDLVIDPTVATAHALVADDLADEGAALRDQLASALADASAYRELALAAIARSYTTERDLRRTRAAVVALRREASRYTASQVKQKVTA